MSATVDLKFNYPSVDDEAFVIENFFKNLNRGDLNKLLSFPPYQGTQTTLKVAANWLNLSAGLYPDVVDIVLCTTGNQALFCILQALRPYHSVIIAEPFTYSAFNSIALNKGYQLKPSGCDENGFILEQLEKVINQTKSKLLYLQPTIQNPTCTVMSTARRHEIARLAEEKDLLVIEDDAYRFLYPDPPPSFLDIIPERTIHIASLSKPFNPLVKTTYLVVPARFTTVMVEAVRLSSSGHSSLLGHLANHLLQTDILGKIIIQKQALARKLQLRAKEILKGLSFQTCSTSFHIWLRLPELIKGTDLVHKAARQGIAISGGTDFCITNPQEGERYIRLALGSEKDRSKLEAGLEKVVSLLHI